MLHMLDKLYYFMQRVSRVPGLGFLQGQATSVMRIKGTMIDAEDQAEGTKQGVKEGLGAVRGLFGKEGAPPAAGASAATAGGRVSPGDVGEPTRSSAAGYSPASPDGAGIGGTVVMPGDGFRQRPDGQSDRPRKPNPDVRVQKKQLMKKLRG